MMAEMATIYVMILPCRQSRALRCCLGEFLHCTVMLLSMLIVR